MHEKLALLLCKRDVVVLNPSGWEEALLRKSNNDNIEFSDQWEILDPNDEEEFDAVRTGTRIELMWKSNMALRKGSMKQHRKGVGGGPGDPANHSD